MKTYTDLLPHQADAFQKLKSLKIGALYMGMGTGKTRTALELIKLRLDSGKVDRVLWLCPCNVRRDLRHNIQTHSDLYETGLLTICGIETLSASVKTCSRLLSMVRSNRVFLVVDESSLVKNHAALRSIHITQLAAGCLYRLILNGTPVTRSYEDLFSQWFLLDWRILGYRSFWSFSANHLEYDDRGRIRRALNVDYLVSKMSPYTFQCTSEECFTLPAKQYSSRGFYLTDEQLNNYDYVIQRLLTSLDEMKPESIYQLFGALQSVSCGYSVTVDKRKRIDRFPLFPDPADNPRIQALLEALYDNSEKCIIFCKYTDEILSIVKLLNSHVPGIAVPFYGGVSSANREASIESFRGSAQYLVANKSCGAFGINLQFCHKIIYYSNDWDWGTRAQSEDRIWRYGQTVPCEFLDIFAFDTIDIKILDCLSRKGNIADALKCEIKKSQSKSDFISMLHGGVYGKDLSKPKRL
jgi:SNF2 family DNA or RNA helicase